jgi:hypothetical protein
MTVQMSKPPSKRSRNCERLIFLTLVAYLFIAAFLGHHITHGKYDWLRWFVLAQCSIVVAMYLYTAAYTILKSWQSRKMGPRVANEIRMGRAFRIIACTAFVVSEMVAICHRLGNNHLSPRTPFVQACLVLLVMAWGYLDRRFFTLEKKTNAELIKQVLRPVEKKIR